MRSVRKLILLLASLAAFAAFASGAGAFPTSGFTIWTIAGDGTTCSTAPNCGDGGPATSAQFHGPSGVAFDTAGNLYVSDTFSNEVRRISPSGTVTRFAGNGTACTTAPNCGDGGPAANAQLNLPTGLAVTAVGDVLISDALDHEVRKVSPSGVITRFAGNGTHCTTAPNCGDSGPATAAQLWNPGGLAVDSAGNVLIADGLDNEVRSVSPAGVITRFAGTGTACSTAPSCADGPATGARLNTPAGVAVDSAGNVYIADQSDNEVRKVSPSGMITTLAGNGSSCGAPPNCGDGGAALSAQLTTPTGIAVDGSGNVYVTARDEAELRVILPSGMIQRVAGNGTPCSSPPVCGDGGAATNAQLNLPFGIALDAAGGIYIGDVQDNEVRWLTGPQGGPVGPAGPTGSQGPAGARGPGGAAGPAGNVELITCKAVTKTIVKRAHGKRRKVQVKKQQCTARSVTGTVKFTVATAVDRATLSRAGVVYAKGIRVRGVGVGSRFVLRELRPLSSGRYTLSLRERHGRRWVTVARQIKIV